MSHFVLSKELTAFKQVSRIYDGVTKFANLMGQKKTTSLW